MAVFNSSVWNAASTGNLHKLETALVSYPYLIDKPYNGQTPMFIAAQNGHVAIIEKLAEFGSRAIDTPDRCSWTPMYVAALCGHASVIETLVRLGSVAIDTPTRYGWTPMLMAAQNGHVSVIKTLMRLGSKTIDTPDNHGWTPMHVAVHNGHVSVIETLVQLGSNTIDVLDNEGCTPLHKAIYCNSSRRVKILKMLGANCSIVQNEGMPDNLFALLNTQVDEDESKELRSRVYFSRSLMERLLFELDARRNRKTTLHAQTRFN